MQRNQRERIWVLLSELFVDTELKAEDLQALGQSLREVGEPPSEVERVLRSEVAPVCGRWMLFAAPVGPWPGFDEADLKKQIEAYLQAPWYRCRPMLAPLAWWLLSGVRRDWQVAKFAMQGGKWPAARNGN